MGASRARAAISQGLRAENGEVPRQSRARPEARRERPDALEQLRGAREGRPRRRAAGTPSRGIPLAHRGAAHLALRAGATHAASCLLQAPPEVLGRAPALTREKKPTLEATISILTPVPKWDYHRLHACHRSEDDKRVH